MMRHSGIGTYIRNIVPAISRCRPDFRFTVLCGDLAAARSVFGPDVRLVRVASPIYSLREQLAIPLRAGPCDLLWSPHYNAPLLTARPLMVTVHDLAHVRLPELFPQMHKRLYAHAMLRAAVNKARAVLCVSSFTKNELLDVFGDRLTGKCHVVHNGLDPSWLDLPPGPSPHAAPYVLYVGNVKPHKNISRLLEAFAAIAARVPHDLVLVGQESGFRTGDASALTKAQAMPDRIHFTGHVDQQQLKQYYAHATLLAFPSLYEGFGLPALEAFAVGCPVLASRAGPFPEVCGPAAEYVDPYSADSIAGGMMKLIEDPARRESLVQMGRDRARQFSWSSAAERVAAVMVAIAGRSAARDALT